jgi:hypothetical protein
VIFGQALTQTIQTFGDGLAGETGKRLRARVDLDAGDDAELGQVLRERRAVLGFLAQGFIVKDHAADVVGDVRRGEQQLAIRAACFLRRFQLDAVEALLDRAAGFVGGQNTLALRDHCARNRLELTAIHTFLRSRRKAHGHASSTTPAVRRV